MDNFIFIFIGIMYNINDMARPTKQESIAISKRNAEIFAMSEKGYPLDYIASFYNLTKGRVVQILKKESERQMVEEGNKKNGPARQ